MVLRYSFCYERVFVMKEGGGCLVGVLVRKGGGWVFDGTR